LSETVLWSLKLLVLIIGGIAVPHKLGPTLRGIALFLGGEGTA
jgi:hypothetical protein